MGKTSQNISSHYQLYKHRKWLRFCFVKVSGKNFILKTENIIPFAILCNKIARSRLMISKTSRYKNRYGPGPHQCDGPYLLVLPTNDWQFGDGCFGPKSQTACTHRHTTVPLSGPHQCVQIHFTLFLISLLLLDSS